MPPGACDFSNVDEQIRDQVIEKCRSNKVRTKLLEKGHGLTLQQLQTIAATIEMTESHRKHIAEDSSSTSGRETVASVKAGMPRGRPGRGGNALSRHPSGVRGPNTTNRGGRRAGESSSGHGGHRDSLVQALLPVSRDQLDGATAVDMKDTMPRTSPVLPEGKNAPNVAGWVIFRPVARQRWTHTDGTVTKRELYVT